MNSVRTLALLLPMLLAGCATGYHSTGFTGGFSETWLAPDVVRVNFRGNGWTDPERAQDFALLRAAELGMTRGFSHVVVRSEQDSTRLDLSRYGLINKPRSAVTVQLLRGGGSGALDANFLRDSMRAKYGLR